MLSPQVIGQGLQRLGYQPTPENIQRASDMLQQNPQLLDKLMGLQGGAGGESGADSSIMLSQLDKLAGTGQSNGMTVGNGNPNQPPLPQAPLPENMRTGNGASSPASVAAPTRPSITTQGAGIDNTGNTNGPVSGSSIAAPSRNMSVPSVNDGTPVSGLTSAGGLSSDTPLNNSIFTYNIDPTGQIPDQFIAAGGSIAAGAALYAKAKADYANVSKANPSVSSIDMAPPVTGPRAISAGDLGVSDPAARPKSGVEMTLDDLVAKTAPRTMQEKDLYPGQTPSEVESVRKSVTEDPSRKELNDKKAKTEGRRALTAAERAGKLRPRL